MNRITLWLMMSVLLSSLAMASLSISLSDEHFESTGVISVQISGPTQAKTFVEITSPNGFYLPIVLDDLSDSTFDVVLESQEYVFKASTSFQGEDMVAKKNLDLREKIIVPPTQETSSPSNEEYEILFKVEEFEGDPIEDVVIYVVANESNTSFSTNESGEILKKYKESKLKLTLEKDSYVIKKKIIHVDEDETFTFILLPKDSSLISETKFDEEDNPISKKVTVTLNEFETPAYSSAYVPILFEVEGGPDRCQVLTKNVETSGYTIAQTVLSPKKFNEVILTELVQGEYDVRIRCIIDAEQAMISQTERIMLVDMTEDVEKLNEFKESSQQVLDKINAFPTSFKQVFIDEIISLEDALSSSKELSKQLQTDANILEVQTKIRELLSTNTGSILRSVKVDSTENIIAYVGKEDVDIIIDYLDLSKSNKLLLAEQEQFATKTNYNFVTLTYLSGLIKKQTFVSNQVIPIEGNTANVGYDEYFVMPTFLLSRLAKTNDVLTKSYDDKLLVRLLENSSALIFDGWLDDVTLIKTVILTDAQSLRNEITGSIIEDVSFGDWKTPILAFIILIVIAGLLFNPYYSPLDALSKNHLKSFISLAHSCIDASVSKEHYKVIDIIPQILSRHEKLSSTEKEHVQEIILQVQELFYESSFHLSLQKISSKPAHLWSFEELEVAIKDFYGSYSQLSAQKQQMYLSYFNQMITHSQQLLSQVQK